MRDSRQKSDRNSFIDTIQERFLQRNNFWILVSILSFFSLIILQIIFSTYNEINLKTRQEIDFLVIPILVLFLFSIFWRGFLPAFLSIAGALTTNYGMVYVYVQFAGLKTLSPMIANRLGYGIISSSGPSIQSFSELFYFVGILSLVLCMTIAFRPSFFRAKERENSLPYSSLDKWRVIKNAQQFSSCTHSCHCIT